MDLRPHIQDIQRKHTEHMQQQTQKERRKQRHYNNQLVQHIVKLIMQKQVSNGDRIMFAMRMDDKRPFFVEEINLLLKQHYVKVKRISVQSTGLNSCTINPGCIFCCPCISIPKITMNCFFGTLYKIYVYLDV
jgi:hypothetical protein